MTALQAALLGIIQGLTEFLPISSSAHLILARAAFGWDAGEFGLVFDVACHVGTLAAVVVYFRRDLVAMVASTAGLGSASSPEPVLLARHIVIGTIPIVVIGLLFADALTALRTPVVAATALAGGALVMLAAERVGSRSRTADTLSSVEALGLGFAQAAALVPGVSRSGAVLTVAMLFGLRRKSAARFAFLLGIPAICGAAGREVLEMSGQAWPAGMTVTFIVGMVTSAVAGYLTVKYFIRYLADHALDIFASYRLVLAAVIVLVLVSS